MKFYLFLFPLFTAVSMSLSAAVLEVGDGKPFLRIEDAVAQAKSGDEIVVHPQSGGTSYQQPAVQIQTAKLTIRTADPKQPVVLDGEGYNYSGSGSVPRAIFQFNPGADGCILDGFTLINARGSSNNGAGVRINQANDVTIRNCVIRHNDMGIMSNGEATQQTAARQLIEKCTITENGTQKEPGQNHNLYLGGTSVTVRNCEVARSVTGHNVKSRAHLNYIIDCHIHDSNNREFDLVDATGTTDRPGSDSFLINNIIEKDPKCTGNRTVLHFGRDGSATHNGTVWFIGNVIRTAFVSPVAEISSGNGAVFIDNVIDDTGEKQRGVLANLNDQKMTVSGKGNTIPDRFVIATPQGEQSPILAPPPLPKDLPKSEKPRIAEPQS
ncbi:MAG: right-handed parallel beta-helix repeat-containing protein [Planctomycetaceae bacterium]|jgi:hypothetical protein|nr:right-handed parallel beta-helix repeat-containing protein [Planctomycetaceae bacterium]